jgi:endonuclease/exonuclease/phosphatase family metal-dependent hydrolase
VQNSCSLKLPGKTRKPIGWLPAILILNPIADAEKLSSTPVAGGNKTYNAFGEDKEINNKIDFVFVKKDASVLSHKVDTTLYNNLFPSDHYPVIVRLDLSVPLQQ